MFGKVFKQDMHRTHRQQRQRRMAANCKRIIAKLNAKLKQKNADTNEISINFLQAAKREIEKERVRVRDIEKVHSVQTYENK